LFALVAVHSDHGGTLTIDTRTSNFDTLLGVYTGSAVNALTKIAANDNISGAIKQSEVSFTAVAGTTYKIAVDGLKCAVAVSC